MANDFFDTGDYTQLIAHTLARGSAVNAIFAAIEVGFDRLPAMLQLNQDRVTYAADTGAANAYAIALPKTLAAYTAGLRVVMLATNANTGASTINIDGLGVKSIKRADGTDLSAGDIGAGRLVTLGYDGTNFQLLSGPGSDAALSAHAALTAAHGATGAVVGTTNVQTLTNKTITSPSIGGTVSGGATYSAITLSGVTTLPGSGAISAAGLLGLGMTAVNILDITQSQDAASIAKLLNAHAGTSASGQLQLANGTSTGAVIQYGASFTTAGIARQNGTRLDASGAGGLTLSTSANQPVYVAVNSTEVGRWTANTFNVGSTVDNATYPLHIERIRNGVAAAQIINSDAGASAVVEFSAYNGTSAALLMMHGTGFTTAGINRQNGAKLTSFGAGGLTIATDAAQPIYFAANSAEVGRWTTNTFNIGSTIDSAATLFSASRAQNDTSSVSVANSDAGTAARAEFSASCGGSPLVLGMRGSGFTTAGINRQNGGFMTAGGAGGLTVGTTANQPVYFAANSTEVGRWNANTFNVGGTTDNVAIPVQVLRARNGDSLVFHQNTDGGASATMSYSLNNGTATGALKLFGSGFTTAGINRQNGLILEGGGAGGLTLNTAAAQPVYVAVNSAEVARFDSDATAGNTRFMLYDVDNGTLERVSVGAANSGGAGFKLLRIPN